MVAITCYDGVGTVGGNKILLEDGGTKLWLDFGLDFSRMGMYYEEFIQPKSCTGIYEYVRMGLLPPIRDLYRNDLVSSRINPWDGIEHREIGDVAGILLSHAHVDHLGSLPYVRADVPVYASAMTLAIAKASQHTGMGGISAHYCYTAPYEETETGELKSMSHTKMPSQGRPYVFVGEKPSTPFSDFWMCTPSSQTDRGRKHDCAPIGTMTDCGGLKVRRFPVDHSVYGACAWAIETSAGTVVYSGDIRCHGRHADLTWKFAEDAARLKPRVLIIEGTRIESDATSTEDQVQDRALDVVRNTSGLVIADFGARNVERLISFLRIAKEAGRKLVLTEKDAYLLDAMIRADSTGEIPSLDDEDILIYAKYEGMAQNWKKQTRENHGGKYISPTELAGMQDKIVLCFSFFDVNELAYINPVPGSVWIYSTCEPFCEEMQMDLAKLRNWLTHYGVALLGVTEEGQEEKSPFHVSGHACRSDLLKVIDIIRPQSLVIVHTPAPLLYAETIGNRCQVILPERGVPIYV